MLHEPLVRIVVPASNEEERISSTIREYCEHFGERARIVVVANGCDDGTERVVVALQERYSNLALISITGRIGKGGAVRAGFSSGVEPLLGFADADGSTNPREFDRLITSLREFEADGVIGSRWMRGAVMQRPQLLVRRIASRVFNGVVRLLFGLRYRDTQCGAKVFRRSAIDKVFSRLEISNFAFDVDLLYQLRRAGCTVIESPIAWTETFTASKVRLLAASYAMLVAVVRLRLRDTLASRIPFFEYLGRRSLIPVRDSFRLLIFGAEREGPRAVDKYVDELALHWQAHGHDVQWIRASTISTRGRISLWYALFGRSEFDAIVEVASPLPYFLPALSVKPKYLVVNDPWDVGARSAAMYRRFYGKVPRVEAGDALSAAGQAQAIVDDVKSSGMYLALFDRLDGNWSINFTDLASRTAKRQQL